VTNTSPRARTSTSPARCQRGCDEARRSNRRENLREALELDELGTVPEHLPIAVYEGPVPDESRGATPSPLEFVPARPNGSQVVVVQEWTSAGQTTQVRTLC